MRRQFFFGECARNEKHILNDRGDAKIQRDQRNKTAFFKNSPSIYDQRRVDTYDQRRVDTHEQRRVDI